MPKQEDVKIEFCLHCKRRSLLWDRKMKFWRCRECRYIYTDTELSEYLKSKKKTPDYQRSTHPVFTTPLWLVNLLESQRFWKLLICSAIVLWCWTAIQYSGNDLGLAIGLASPILLLYAVKVILRKFLPSYQVLATQGHLSQIFYSIRKSSFLRFGIILATIILLVTTIWSVVSIILNITQITYVLNMLVIIAAQIWLLNWLCGMLKHSRQLSSKPRFAIVFWSFFGIAIFFAFVGVPPFSDIKNTAVTSAANWWDRANSTDTPEESSTKPPTQNLPPPSTPTYPSTTTYVDEKDKNHHWVWVNDYTKLASTSGRTIELYENPSATNPTWNQLLSFLKADNTDKMTYIPESFVCVDFAEMLHNNAEKAGIRCGLVVLHPILHACNAFETTDEGLVFVDCTGQTQYQTGPYDKDAIVNVQLGKDYVPRFLFSNQTWNATWTIQDMGTVTRYQICWVAGEIMDFQYDYATASTSYIPPYIPPSSSYIPPYTPTPTPPPSVPVCSSCCEDRCSKYQGVWHNGCIDDCMKGGTEKWSWK